MVAVFEFPVSNKVTLDCLQPALGTNPLAVAAPGNDGDSFVLDMATSAVALGKVS